MHDDWGDNVFIEFFQDGAIDRVAETAAIKVTRDIRTARHCMFPMEGRGVVAQRRGLDHRVVAVDECLRKGLTSFHDAGVSFRARATKAAAAVAADPAVA